MSKPKTIFRCQTCGHETVKWSGRCPACGAWNTLAETRIEKQDKPAELRTSSVEISLLSEIAQSGEARRSTGIDELDRVLGGGVMPASVVLISGDPGIGKSTLLLQMAASLVRQNISCLYVSGEESLKQIKTRADRLAVGNIALPLLAETELENVLYQVQKNKPEIVIVDSIQSIYSSNISGAPGQMGQMRECTARLFRAAKEEGWSLFLVGHITKEGSIAGPKLLEHTVDVVIYFEGDTFYQYRILRSLKNRFGATHEIGLFLMEQQGLKEVENPSSLFLSDSAAPQIGSSVVCSFEGSRPILAEVQSLVSRANYGVPQRTVSGFDQKRLALLLAILEKHCRLDFGTSDVFVKIAGGLRIDDPGIDLGIAMAIFSSRTNRVLPAKSVYIGEIGLNGDLRPVSQAERRVQEAVKLGFRRIYLPAVTGQNISRKITANCQVIPVKHISSFMETISTGSMSKKKVEK